MLWQAYEFDIYETEITFEEGEYIIRIKTDSKGRPIIKKGASKCPFCGQVMPEHVHIPEKSKKSK